MTHNHHKKALLLLGQWQILEVAVKGLSQVEGLPEPQCEYLAKQHYTARLHLKEQNRMKEGGAFVKGAEDTACAWEMQSVYSVEPACWLAEQSCRNSPRAQHFLPPSQHPPSRPR